MIVLALLVLACSYWRLSGYLNSVEADSAMERSSGARNGGDKSSTGGEEKELQSVSEHVVVIMAGDEKPTFLATHANQNDDDSDNCNSSISNVSSSNNNNNE
ncbi:hypothetical protein LUZ60_017225 [Juncus effusus]|nr:hypothetical protein LUZ60_017225 [Juncus effusus]